MAGFSSKVEVTFIDDATGESFGVAQMPPANLPESFELDTTIHLGDDDWSVVYAQPKTRREYAKSKTLILRVIRVQKVELSKIQYSMATIRDRLPPLQDGRGNPNDSDYVLHEDDWGQVEFVAQNDFEYIAAQVAEIRQFKMDNWTGHGWKNIFVRPDHPTDFASLNIAFDDLRLALPDLSQNGVVVFQSFSNPTGSARAVLGGFSFRVNDATIIYGHHVAGIVASLAAHVYVENSPEIEAISWSLESIARLSPLLLVDWNTDSLVTLSDTEEINKWLTFLADPG
jgi:hypothetical protein